MVAPKAQSVGYVVQPTDVTDVEALQTREAPAAKRRWRLVCVAIIFICLLGLYIAELSVSWLLLCFVSLYVGEIEDVRKDTLVGRLWHRLQRSSLPTFFGLALITLITLLARMAHGANGDLRSDAVCCAFAVLLCALRIRLKWKSIDSVKEVKEVKGIRANCCCCCSACGILLALSLLGQILGSWIYLAGTSAPSFTDSYPSVAYWCHLACPKSTKGLLLRYG